jgi:hypothetical protein
MNVRNWIKIYAESLNSMICRVFCITETMFNQINVFFSLLPKHLKQMYKTRSDM